MGYIVASYKMRGSLILLAEEGTGAPEHYTLYGVIVHVGELISSGHYYYYVRTSSAWYCLDDYRVFKVSEKAVLDAKAYIMLYALDRQETSNGAEMSQINTADDAEREKCEAGVGKATGKPLGERLQWIQGYHEEFES
ncbi:predicted protein [Arabidopsis lyrata subsp. lyrata]|uniref:Predicted protein n=1 Tax=Arabidopsis lyrata subsp. lyrata TaxID=81972 RepID=D7KPU9_ARALL|nr:predicted protein [Arabidopsis lyrata subsp. lyrata]